MRELVVVSNLTKEVEVVDMGGWNQYKKVYSLLIEGKDEIVDIVREGENHIKSKYAFSTKIIGAMYFGKDHIFYRKKEVVMHVNLIFEDISYDLLVVGSERTKRSYEFLKKLIGKKPTGTFLEIPQDQSKGALIRHSSILREILIDEVDKKDLK